MTRRVLLIGATGVFGARLARHLASLQGIGLFVTSRDESKAKALAASLAAGAKAGYVTGLGLDRNRNAAARFADIKPFLVIDASGPFQEADFSTARAAIEAGAHWIDLADASSYVAKFGDTLDGLARRHAVSAFAGASSTPALSTAVVTALTKGWTRIDTAELVICPAGDGPAGLSVLKALLTYAGRPIAIWRDGRRATITGWGTAKRVRVAGLGMRTISPVETADAVLLPELLSVTSRVSFSAGLESRLEHFGLLALAKLRASGWIRDLQPLAPWLERGRRLTRLWSSGNGSMTVEVSGIDGDGNPTTANWSLIARQGDGPHVPVLPALALTRRVLSGTAEPGARSAAGALDLGTIEAEMRGLAIETSHSRSAACQRSLYEAVFGDEAFAALPKSLRAFHGRAGAPVWSGSADVETGHGVLARFVRRVFGFPPDGRGVPLSVSVDRVRETETWHRNFSGARFSSRLVPAGDGQVAEVFYPFLILMRLRAGGGQIEMPVIGWRIGPLPLPRFLAPKSQTREFQDEFGRFRFDVRISAPGIGLIAHYKGWLEPGAGFDAAGHKSAHQRDAHSKAIFSPQSGRK